MLVATKLARLGVCVCAGLLFLAACGSSSAKKNDASATGGNGGSAGSGAGGGNGGGGSPSPANKLADIGAAPGGLAFANDDSGKMALFVSLPSKNQLAVIDSSGTVGPSANVPSPAGIALGTNGDLLVCGTSSGNSDAGASGTLWDVKPDGTKTPFATNAAFGALTSVAVAPDDHVVISDSDNKVYSLAPDGTSPAIITASLTKPTGLAFSADGSELYMVSNDAGTLWQLDRSAAVGNYAPSPTELASGLVNPTAVVVMQNTDLVVVTQGGLLRFSADGKTKTVVADKSAFSTPIGGAFGVGAFGDTNLYLGDAQSIVKLAFTDHAITLPVH
jgi:hypothetical protein